MENILEDPRFKVLLAVISWIIILFGLYEANNYSYHLFHSLVELFSVIVAIGLFIVAWNSRKWTEHSYFLILGVAYLFVGVIDMVHTLSYKRVWVSSRWSTVTSMSSSGSGPAT